MRGNRTGGDPLHIVFFAHFAGSLRHGMVYGHYHLASEWVAMGHKVTIVAAGWVHTRHVQPQIGGRVTEEWIDGIRYLWISVPSYNPAGRIGRVLNLIGFALQTRFLPLRIVQGDIVICSSHCPFAIYAAAKHANKWHARLVFEVRDLWPLTLVELGGASRGNPLIKAMQRAEDYAYRNADYVVSVLPASREYMIAHGMNPDKFAYIPNGFVARDEEIVPLPERHKSTLTRLREQNRFIVGYAGRVGLANALDALIKAVAVCVDDAVCVVILGEGSHKSNLARLVEELKLGDRIYFMDPVGKRQVGEFLRRIDVAYIGLEDSPLFRFGVSPTKMNDYLAAGKPVICAIDAPCDAISESGAAIRCGADNPMDIANAIRRIRNLSLVERAAMGKRGREWLLGNYSYHILAQRFLAHVMS